MQLINMKEYWLGQIIGNYLKIKIKLKISWGSMSWTFLEIYAFG